MRSADSATESRALSKLQLLSYQQVGGYEESEDYGDYAVHGEEGGVEFGKIVRLDEGMLVEQEQRNGDDAREREFAESESWDHGD